MVGRLVTVLSAVRDQVPLTLLGALVSAAGFFAAERLGAGPNRDLVLWVVGWACLALVALAVTLVLAGALWQWRALRRAAVDPPRIVQAGQPVETGFSLPALTWLPFIAV